MQNNSSLARYEDLIPSSRTPLLPHDPEAAFPAVASRRAHRFLKPAKIILVNTAKFTALITFLNIPVGVFFLVVPGIYTFTLFPIAFIGRLSDEFLLSSKPQIPFSDDGGNRETRTQSTAQKIKTLAPIAAKKAFMDFMMMLGCMCVVFALLLWVCVVILFIQKLNSELNKEADDLDELFGKIWETILPYLLWVGRPGRVGGGGLGGCEFIPEEVCEDLVG